MGTIASFDITSHIENLTHPVMYQKINQIAMENDTTLPIAYSKKGILHTPSHKLYLYNLLHSPNVSYNLLSILKLIINNNVIVFFHKHGYNIKGQSNKSPSFSGILCVLRDFTSFPPTIQLYFHHQPLLHLL